MDKMIRRDVARVRQKTGFVFQSYNLFLNKTCLLYTSTADRNYYTLEMRAEKKVERKASKKA